MAKIAPEMTSTSSVQSAPTTRAANILLAEDGDEMRSVLALRLRQQGYQVTECSNGAELIAELGDYMGGSTDQPDKRRFDLIISDIRMPGVFGLSVVEGGAQYDNFPPTILITAFGDEETHAKARQVGVAAVIDKPFDMNELLAKVRETLAKPSTT
jgi:two-component system, response regulator, stage 0 sporulation protein F